MNSKSSQTHQVERGRIWFGALTLNGLPVAGLPASVLARDVSLAGQSVRVVAVVPDEKNHFPRARSGEVGLMEGWGVARAVNEVVTADENAQNKRPIVAIVNVRSQAYGRREEAFGIHQALAAAGQPTQAPA